MLSPSNRALFGLATAALALILAVYFWPDSSGLAEVATVSNNPAASTSDNHEDQEDLHPKKSGNADALQPSPLNRSASNIEEIETFAFNSSNAHLQLEIVDSIGEAIADAGVFVLIGPNGNGNTRYLPASERILRFPNQVLTRGTTNSSGIAYLGELNAFTKYVALFDSDGYAAVEHAFETDDLSKPVMIGPVPLGPGANIVVEVEESNGAPAVGIGMSMHADPIPENYSTKYPPITEQYAITNEDGIAHLNQLPQIPKFRYAYSGEILRGDSKIVPVGEVSEKGGRIHITVPTSDWIEGSVVDTSGNPVAGAQATITRTQNWNTPDEMTEEQLREHRPSMLWGSHTELAQYKSDFQTDETGTFRAKVPAKNSSWGGSDQKFPDMLGAVVLLGDDFGQCSYWTSIGDRIEVVVPMLYPVTGRVLDDAGNPVAGAAIEFHDRLGPGESKPEKTVRDFSFRFDCEPAKCDAQGYFTKNLLPAHYWAEVQVPGGSHFFPGPYSITQSQEIGIITIPTGRIVQLIARTSESQTISGLEARRSETPIPKESGRGSTFPSRLSRSEPNTPWGDRDSYWGSTSADGHVKDATATWCNEPNGSWRYLLEAPGFVPAVIDLKLDDGVGDQTIEVPMEATGRARIKVTQRDGTPATGITIFLSPAKDKPEHPISEKLNQTFRFRYRPEQEAQPDENGVVRFHNMYPGEFEIISKEGEDADRYSRGDSERPILATFKVVSGEVTEVEASLAEMAEIKIWVTRDGQLLPNAEVFAVAKDTSPWSAGEMLDPDASGNTDADGACLVSSLTPDQLHIIGARIPDGSRLYGVSTPWTMQEVMIKTGPQEATVELSSGGVRLRLESGGLSGDAKVSIVAVSAPLEIPADADEDTKRLYNWSNFRQRVMPDHTAVLFSSVAGNYISFNEAYEFAHMPPGKDQAIAEKNQDEKSFRIISSPFEVGREMVDIGTLKLIPLLPTEVTVTGVGSLELGVASDLKLSCFPVGGSRAMEESMWFKPDEKMEWELPVGHYELVLFYDQVEAFRSPEFSVNALGTTEFTWTITDFKLPEKE